jgi:hypothetical protein
MSFQLSPGVNVTEIDLTTIVPQVAVSAAGIAGKFQWGPEREQVQKHYLSTTKMSMKQNILICLLTQQLVLMLQDILGS